MKVEDRLFGYIEEGAQLLIDSKFDAAIEMFTKADELIEFVADKDMANKVKATCVAAKALALSNSGRKEEAAKLDKEAVDLSRNLHYDNKRTSASSKIFMGLSLAGQGKIDEVIAIADEVLDDLGDDALNLIGVAQLYEYDLDNNYEKAKKALLKARTSLLPRVAESPDLMLDIQYKLANIAQKCEHNDKQAMFEYEKGWRFIEELGVERFSTLYALRIPFFASLLEKETKSISQNLSEAPEKSGVEAFARIFPVPLRNFGICT
ncbi:MAG: hypothetical protein LBT59_11175 [Clostridiales bacterium]|jgi:tetratricopeptide (TPR) repeat protein|nr:hypothetical protein [Clostridiales bacterium]